jgi:hypothetical protein
MTPPSLCGTGGAARQINLAVRGEEIKSADLAVHFEYRLSFAHLGSKSMNFFKQSRKIMIND